MVHTKSSPIQQGSAGSGSSYFAPPNRKTSNRPPFATRSIGALIATVTPPRTVGDERSVGTGRPDLRDTIRCLGKKCDEIGLTDVTLNLAALKIDDRKGAINDVFTAM
jgi:hypothetical protein